MPAIAGYRWVAATHLLETVIQLNSDALVRLDKCEIH